MATELEKTIDLIAEGLEDEARANLVAQRAVRTGFLRDSVEVTVRSGDDFQVNFADYGVFIDQGRGGSAPRPFYSDLVEDGPAEGSYEDEIEQMLEEAFDMDVEQLDETIDL